MATHPHSGRRPGDSGTRVSIENAARRQFAELGYDRTSMRQVAREAGVDPTLVSHFYGSKQQLFVSVVGFPFRPVDVLPGLLEGDPEELGLRLARFVLGVFEGEALWATLFAQFQDGQIVGLSTSAALDADDVKDVVGRDQHPFLLAAVANRYRRPAFGWFCERADFEAYLLAPTVEEKEVLFQTALMRNRATFDFNILLDKGLTALSPMNPGEAAIAGSERGDNPRTAVPDPGKPAPDPSQEG